MDEKEGPWTHLLIQGKVLLHDLETGKQGAVDLVPVLEELGIGHTLPLGHEANETNAVGTNGGNGSDRHRGDGDGDGDGRSVFGLRMQVEQVCVVDRWERPSNMCGHLSSSATQPARIMAIAIPDGEL